MLSDTVNLIIVGSNYSTSPVNCCAVSTDFLTALWKWTRRLLLTLSKPLSISLWVAIPPQNYTITTNNRPPHSFTSKHTVTHPIETPAYVFTSLILHGSISKVYRTDCLPIQIRLHMKTHAPTCRHTWTQTARGCPGSITIQGVTIVFTPFLWCAVDP